MPCFFPSKVSLKNDPSSLTYNTNEKNQALKLLLVTAAENLLLQLDLLARKCSSFIFNIISISLL